MKKRIISFLTVTMMSVMCLSGCGKSNDKKVVENNAGESKDGTVQLTIWGAEADQDILTSMVESFKEKYKSEAQFDITIGICEESDARDTVLSDIEGAADVFAFADDQISSFVAGGVLDPVTDSSVSTSNNEKAVLAGTVNDKLYAYPMTADNGYFMYYNKAYFNEEDLKSLNKMLDVAAQNNKKVTMDWASGYYLYSFFEGAGLSCYINEDGVTNTCKWNSTDSSVKGTDVAQGMLAIAGHSGFISLDDEGFINGVKDGSVIAGVNGVWNSQKVKEAWGDNFGAVKLPTYNANGKDVQMASFAGYKFVGVNSYSKNTEWAHRLAEWVTNEENQTKRFKERGLGPSNINSANSDEVKASPAIQALLEQSEFATIQRIGSGYWNPVKSFGEKMAAGNPGGEDLQKILDALVEEITALVSK